MSTTDVLMELGSAAHVALSWAIAVVFIAAGCAALVSLIKEMREQ